MSEEFSIPIALAELSPQGITMRRKADTHEKAALAARLAVDTVEKLEIDVSIVPDANGQSARVDGTLDATVRQICSVSLAPLIAKHALAVALQFTDSDIIDAEDLEEIDPEESDPPEPIVDGRFDVGDTLIQLLAVEIDPFPRKPGVSLEDVPGGTRFSGEQNDSESNPFAVLSEFRDKLKDR